MTARRPPYNSTSSSSVSAVTRPINNNNKASNKPHRPYVIAVSTSKQPTSSQTTTSNSDPTVFLCPYTGSILTSLKTGSSLGGITSLSLYSPPSNKSLLFLAYASKSQDDAHIILTTTSSQSNSIQWKCRPTEHLTAGLAISSHTGRYVIGGGSSGKCYLWSTLHGTLVRIWNAHYRCVSCIMFDDSGEYVISGGADGVVNVYTLMDLLAGTSTTEDRSGGNSNTASAVSPVRTWSEHHLPMTSLYSLPGGDRIVSTSTDRRLILMELFSGVTLARIQMCSGINSITSDTLGRRLYCGGMDGVIYCLDLDSFAMKETVEGATMIVGGRRRGKDEEDDWSLSGGRLGETLLGTTAPTGTSSSSGEDGRGGSAVGAGTRSYQTELRGHNGPVTALSILEGGGNDGDGTEDLLVSGSDDGTVRIWDLKSRCCVRTVSPWSTSTSSSSAVAGQQQQATTMMKARNPISSILVVSRSSMEHGNNNNGPSSRGGGGGGMFSGGGRNAAKTHGESDVLSLLKPLQRFVKTGTMTPHPSSGQLGNNDDDNEEDGGCCLIPFMGPFGDRAALDFWDTEINHHVQEDGVVRSKRRRLGEGNGGSIVPQSRKKPVVGQDEKEDEERAVAKEGSAIAVAEETRGEEEKSKTTAAGRDESDDGTVAAKLEKQKKEEKEEISRLQKELEEAKSTIKRWEKVNNKLAAKLKKATAAAPR